MYEILATDGLAKLGRLTTTHGVIETPVFMNVATQAAIKGAITLPELKELGCQIALCNTYHLHVRPGDELIRERGGLRAFTGWDGPLLTDSGGFQVFSLASLRKITGDGVMFASHVDGRRLFIGPDESMEIQSNLGSTIAMAFDECVPSTAERSYIIESVERTTRWLARCIGKLAELNRGDAINQGQMLFAINQGGVLNDIRIEHAKTITGFDVDGFAIGGLAVGESAEEMYDVLDHVIPHLPQTKPTYLMGVGTPENIIEAVSRGIDFFDCVLPARNGRHANVYTSEGRLNLLNQAHARSDSPIDAACACQTCRSFSRAYIRHLFKAGEMLAMRLCVIHNLHFYNNLMADIRTAIENGTLGALKNAVINSE